MEYTTKYESIVLMGKVTSGKGTQAHLILDHFGGNMFSVGNMVREHAKENNSFGHKVKEMYEEGYLVPEWLASYWMTHALLSQYVDQLVVFEAVARKEKEAEQFAQMHEWLDREYIVFNLEISDDVVRQRSAARKRDVVDTQHAVEKRLQEYQTHTVKSLKIFEEKGCLVTIDGTLPIEEVTDQIFSHLRS